MSELRKDPVIGRWVIISPERGLRPHDFAHNNEPPDSGKCPFCEGNEDKTPRELYAVRDGSAPDSPGWKLRVMPNKFPVLHNEEIDTGDSEHGLYQRMNGVGTHEVVIETPEHGKRIEMHTPKSLREMFEVYKLRLLELGKDERFHYIIIFKNEGEKAGASLSHPHSQIIATPVTPKRVKEELAGAKEYYLRTDRCIFCDIIAEEQAARVRVVDENEGFIAFCPYASRFPFETWVLPKRHSPDYHSLDEKELGQLAETMLSVMKKLSGVLKKPQYNYILHTGPQRYRKGDYWKTLDLDWHWHIEIIPRITDVAGFEWGTGYYINPTTPEDAAAYMVEI